MTTTAEKSGTYALGDRTVKRMGYGAMQLAGPHVMGPPEDRDGAIAVLRRADDRHQGRRPADAGRALAGGVDPRRAAAGRARQPRPPRRRRPRRGEPPAPGIRRAGGAVPRRAVRGAGRAA